MRPPPSGHPRPTCLRLNLKRIRTSKDCSMSVCLSFGLPVAKRAGAVTAPFLLAPAAAMAQDKDPLVAKVNGTEIHQSDLDIVETEAGQIPPMSEAAKKDYLVAFMTDMILVSKAAQDQKLGDTREFAKKVEFNRNKLLMSELLEKPGKAALTSEAMHKVYDDGGETLPRDEEGHDG